jgi:hypothetical protein
MICEGENNFREGENIFCVGGIYIIDFRIGFTELL